jgi:hypothetical protein
LVPRRARLGSLVAFTSGRCSTLGEDHRSHARQGNGSTGDQRQSPTSRATIGSQQRQRAAVEILSSRDQVRRSTVSPAREDDGAAAVRDAAERGGYYVVGLHRPRAAQTRRRWHSVDHAAAHLIHQEDPPTESVSPGAG